MRDARAALPLYVNAARQGHGKAMTMVGRFREEGWGGTRIDLAAALRWYARGAAREDFRAHWQLARLAFSAGDHARGLSHLQPAVEGASLPFCREIAAGLLADRDTRVAGFGRRALERVAAGGTAEDIERLAEALERGYGGPVDVAAAAGLRERAQAAIQTAACRPSQRRKVRLIRRIARTLGLR